MSTVSYARYTTTGRITGVGHCVISDLPLQAQSGETTLITANVVNNAENYILAGAVTPRTPLPATWNKTSITADGVDEAVLATLPIPCTVYVDDQSIVVDDGSFEFSSDSAGIYRVKVDAVEHTAITWEITADV
jgi:hypothetical protein|tara:strand:+ start:81 stop:482 length:402 start_codon:yes stop_codon:yes gene_type:complete